MASPSVVIAGRGPTMLLSLKRLLEAEFEVAAMADNVLSMLDALREIGPDLLVIDIGTAEFGGGSLASHLLQRHAGIRVLLVGDEATPPETGCPERCGYVTKDSASETLVPAARDLLARAVPKHDEDLTA